MKVPKRRGDVIDECVNALVACWNHYSDTSLSDGMIFNLKIQLRETLPKTIKTEYEKEMQKQ